MRNNPTSRLNLPTAAMFIAAWDIFSASRQRNDDAIGLRHFRGLREKSWS